MELIFANSIARKDMKYHVFIMTPRYQYNQVTLINPSVSILGTFSLLSTDFTKILEDLNIADQHHTYILGKLSTIAIRSTYYTFCRRDQDWTTPDVLPL